MEGYCEAEYEQPPPVEITHKDHDSRFPIYNLTIVRNQSREANQGLYFVCPNPNCLEEVAESIHSDVADILVSAGANCLDSGLSDADIDNMKFIEIVQDKLTLTEIKLLFPNSKDFK